LWLEFSDSLQKNNGITVYLKRAPITSTLVTRKNIPFVSIINTSKTKGKVAACLRTYRVINQYRMNEEKFHVFLTPVTCLYLHKAAA